MTIDEAIAHAREIAKEKRKEMQCKTCKLFVRSDLHPLQGYCRKNEFRSIEIDSWSKVCSEYVPKEMCKCAEEHEQLAEWLEKLKTIENIMLIYNANWYADEDNGVPDSEVLESIWNVIQDNGLDIDIEQDYRKGKSEGYNKAIDDFIKAADKHCGYYTGECKNLTRDDIICIANNMKLKKVTDRPYLCYNVSRKGRYNAEIWYRYF